MRKVLIFSAPVGSGHVMTAEALAQELRTRENVEVVQADIFSLLPAWVGRSFLRLYLKVLTSCPWLYGLAYSSGDASSEGSFLWLRSWFNRLMLSRARSYLDALHPDIVLATHATPLGFMSLYKEEHPSLWLGAVVPDFNIHHWWVCRPVDAYFLAAAKLKERFPKDMKTLALGLPLRAAFSLAERTALREQLGFEDGTRVVLFVGGGAGLLPMEELLETVDTLKLPKLQLVAVTGKNKQLQDKLTARYSGRKDITVYGFRDDLPQLLMAADILVSKAGAVTAAEAMACRLAYIIYRPLPGQERGNADFLLQQGAAQVAATAEEVARLLASPAALQAAGASEAELHKQAAKNICDYILGQNIA